ncbi:acetylxylan esterase [Coraliomargarita sp. SDUM461004]|uniref:Acetylxylan esterase n=2 Tax=Thalassobacterium sedimentorum TaxID=3041258 RepID=A0ABU1ALN7_9BACT|nr:acetylxylan esterase [Coraliomargarita sp. SDUM461004]
MKRIVILCLGLFLMTCSVNSKDRLVKHDEELSLIETRQTDFEAQRTKVAALADLSSAPEMFRAEGFDSTDQLAAIYYDALDWKGKPTKVFAWIGMPQNVTEDVPAMVLVHGGGGTAFKDWVKEWTRRGYAAISIAVEGQTDQRRDKRWERHEWAGPERNGIYRDSDEPLEDQWMYHAVADTILASSLIRSVKGVDPERVGLMGISWGGVITSTVIGIDNRFVFAIPSYGCGDLAEAANQYGRALSENETYHEVWDPMLRMHKVAMPTLWLSWPEDQHFPMNHFAACYGRVSGEHMVALVPEMGHGHRAPQRRPEGYAFAESLLDGVGPWCVEKEVSLQADLVKVSFSSTKTLESAVLVSTTDTGVTGQRTWVESGATISKTDTKWTVTATLPKGSTAWFINVKSNDLVASSNYQQIK